MGKSGKLVQMKDNQTGHSLDSYAGRWNTMFNWKNMSGPEKQDYYRSQLQIEEERSEVQKALLKK